MGFIAAVVAAGTNKPSGSSLTFPLLLVLIFVGVYFLLLRPRQRRQQAAAQQQKTVTPGALVRTTAGMYATVIAVDGDDVVLEVAPGVEVRYVKRAIMEVISPGGAPGTEDGEAEPFAEPDSFSDGETSGNHEESEDVRSAEEGLAGSRDDRAADRGNVH